MRCMALGGQFKKIVLRWEKPNHVYMIGKERRTEKWR